MRIQNKIVILHAVLVVAFAVGLLYLRDVERSRSEFFKEQEKNERIKVFSQIITMVSANIQGMARDYSLWDEMVTFVATGDKEWAKSNIDGSLKNFDVDVAWVYDLNNKPTYVLTEIEGAHFNEAPVVPLKINEVFQGKPFVNFFVATDAGVMDIHGATINNIADQERKDPQGYILIARIWDQQFLDSLGVMTGTKVIIGDHRDAPSGKTKERTVGEITFEYPLAGLNGREVACLHVSFHSDLIFQGDRISKNISVLIFVFLITVFILVTLMLVSWVSLPLRKISLSLTGEDVGPIQGLVQKENEMGDIARLIKQFFLQKQKLTMEIMERETAEKNLQKAYQDLKAMQNQLFQSEKMSSIGQLAAGVAHEINNPIGFIGNNIEVLKEYILHYKKVLELVDDIKSQVDTGDLQKIKNAVDELERYKKEIEFEFINGDISKLLEHSNRGLERIRKIVMDLRTFGRIDTEDTKESHKIENVIEGILSIVQSEFIAKAELVKDYGDTPAILCSSQRVGQVLINLLVNATQAIKEYGKIVIRTYVDGQFVCVDISDSGCGIPPENIKKLFDPFFTTKPVGQGTGLGLSVSYEIIKKHNGNIKVRSKVGEGTTFTLMFPYVQPV